MNALEEQLHIAARDNDLATVQRILRQPGVDVNAGNPARPMTIVKSNQELDAALAQNQIAVVHTLEGAHVLNGQLANVARFKAKGVAMMAIAHFYENGVAPPVDGVPDWSEQIDLVQSLGSANHFIVETDELARSSIRFGRAPKIAALP